jgi:hypothetical protein
MRSYGLTAAAALLALAAATPATAMPASAPGALRGAIGEQANIETVHCRRWEHWHRWGYGTGCAYNYGPRFYGGPSFYLGSPGYSYRYNRRRW